MSQIDMLVLLQGGAQDFSVPVSSSHLTPPAAARLGLDRSTARYRNINRSRAFRPHCSHQVQPAFQFLPELSGTGIVGATELAHEAEIAEERNSLLSTSSEA